MKKFIPDSEINFKSQGKLLISAIKNLLVLSLYYSWKFIKRLFNRILIGIRRYPALSLGLWIFILGLFILYHFVVVRNMQANFDNACNKQTMKLEYYEDVNNWIHESDSVKHLKDSLDTRSVNEILKENQPKKVQRVNKSSKSNSDDFKEVTEQDIKNEQKSEVKPEVKSSESKIENKDGEQKI